MKYFGLDHPKSLILLEHLGLSVAAMSFRCLGSIAKQLLRHWLLHKAGSTRERNEIERCTSVGLKEHGQGDHASLSLLIRAGCLPSFVGCRV